MENEVTSWCIGNKPLEHSQITKIMKSEKVFLTVIPLERMRIRRGYADEQLNTILTDSKQDRRDLNDKST